MASEEQLQEAAFQLRKALLSFSDQVAGGHRWLWEGERWKELVFALLARGVPCSESQARAGVTQLSELGLLRTEAAWAGDGRQRRHFIEAFQSIGWRSEHADRAFNIVAEAAQGLKEHYGGKVQLLLRKQAEALLKELGRTMPFSSLDAGAAGDAFTLWLQNVADLPISLRTASMTSFCARVGVSEAELVHIADSMDLNLALLDDVLALETRAEEKENSGRRD